MRRIANELPGMPPARPAGMRNDAVRARSPEERRDIDRRPMHAKELEIAGRSSEKETRIERARGRATIIR